jgi:transposase InsO family protein
LLELIFRRRRVAIFGCPSLVFRSIHWSSRTLIIERINTTNGPKNGGPDNDKLQEWEDYYNYDRPHGALAGNTPYERLKQKTQDPLS